ncbi:MAG: hypothetical protein H0T46_22085 [Deltaproteobacteria bacterium]|nr:hypothetical protein [Deltaproteobacteria bacterium]
MIRRHVLAALAAGIAAGDDDAARAALKKIDLVLRRPARKKLERALIDAALATNELGGAVDPEAARHVQRVAALQLAKAEPEDVCDRERVIAAYNALPKVKAGGIPAATIALCMMLSAVSVAATFYVLTLPGPAKRAYARELPPPAAGAFKDGGTPLEDPELVKLFVEDLTTLIIESDRDRQSGGMDRDRKAHSITLISAPAIQKRGPAVVKAWAEMLGMLDKWVSVPASSEGFKDIVREFRHKVRAVSDQLAAAGVGYYLEGDVYTQGDAAHALVYSYRVEEVVFLKAGGQPRRVLNLRRIDNLNISKTVLGYQSQDLGDPVLLLDQIEDHVASHVLPVLAPGAPWVIADEEYQAKEGVALAAAAGEAVRAELLAQLGKDGPAAQKIAALLAERTKIVDDWREILEARGWRLARTDSLFLPENMLEQLESDVPGSERRRVAAIEEELAQLEAPRISSLAQQLLQATVRRHEAQHGLDDDRPEPLRYPPLLEDHLGDELDDDGEPRRRVESARAELSAYISQLANDPTTPQLSLWNVARFAFDDNSVGSSESYAGVLIIEGLARHLGMQSPGPVIHDRRIDRERLTALASPMTKLPGDKLRAAAVALWKELYAEDMVPIVDR